MDSGQPATALAYRDGAGLDEGSWLAFAEASADASSLLPAR
ncbi:hypothetical protein M2222_002359 [Bradyrhizobium elkanii]|nr:hypothetical protein [Bradyrhizobium elkanii]MCS3560037.1 hypothetical protein [Bradyrhizobium elkanii]MCW2150116.1 hypothetical protein [Bradyrhizobium elkanii]MCW2359910.1 hypothetical protein [Bradyrhizobium elkanii]MCW2373848.1 hypothetical protein [Bradyrhizobium elkanii]